MDGAPDRPLVSVVIPCFNQAEFLPAAVSSILSQQYRPVECIVVNDGSTDDTKDVASRLGVRLLNQVNRGVSEARNAGLHAARGCLVVFLDADDELLPAAIEQGVEALARDGAAVAVVGRCQIMDTSGVSLRAFHQELDGEDPYRAWLSRNFVWTTGAAMFRRAALVESGGFPPHVGPAADYAVYLRLARTGRVRVIREDLVRYRQHATSMSRNPTLMLCATLAVLRAEARQAPPSMRRVVARGRRAWCEWYGEQIVDRLRADWRAGSRGAAQFRSAAVLLWHCPGVALRHVARKSRRVAMAVRRRTGAAWRYVRESRARARG